MGNLAPKPDSDCGKQAARHKVHEEDDRSEQLEHSVDEIVETTSERSRILLHHLPLESGNQGTNKKCAFEVLID